MKVLTLSIFSKIPNLIHGFSTRECGSMRPLDPNSQTARNQFLSFLSISPQQAIRMHQIHSNIVRWVKEQDQDKIIDQTDGLLTADKNTFLIVVVGDCVPLLFFDKQKEYSGVAHAGWRGVLNNIAGETIQKMKEAGSNPHNIIVGIGPCIRNCCYKVGIDRLNQFQEKFPGSEYIVNEHYLDLPKLIKRQLEEVGIVSENIEDTGLCTADNLDKFYSYRKEGEKFGEFIGVIGIKK